MDTVGTISTVAATVLTSGVIWKSVVEIVKYRQKRKSELRREEKDDSVMYRNDLKDRVEKLETQLGKQLEDNRDLQKIILQITKENQKTVLDMSVKIKSLEKDVELLKIHTEHLETRNEQLESENKLLRIAKK